MNLFIIAVLAFLGLTICWSILNFHFKKVWTIGIPVKYAGIEVGLCVAIVLFAAYWFGR